MDPNAHYSGAKRWSRERCCCPGARGGSWYALGSREGRRPSAIQVWSGTGVDGRFSGPRVRIQGKESGEDRIGALPLSRRGNVRRFGSSAKLSLLSSLPSGSVSGSSRRGGNSEAGEESRCLRAVKKAVSPEDLTAKLGRLGSSLGPSSAGSVSSFEPPSVGSVSDGAAVSPTIGEPMVLGSAVKLRPELSTSFLRGWPSDGRPFFLMAQFWGMGAIYKRRVVASRWPTSAGAILAPARPQPDP